MKGYGDTSDRQTHTSRRRVLAATGTIGLGVLAGCSGGGDSDGGTSEGSDDESEESGRSADAEGAWQRTELTDVLTGESFSIDGLAGPVAIQSFAVWCPKCQRQSERLADVDESVTVVGLNTDPNEDAEKVRQHAESNGFDWRFAVAPTEMTESLIDEFGTSVTNAPSTPIIVACDDGVAEFFSGSQQSAEQIQSAATEC